jgi:hypothetical protein
VCYRFAAVSLLPAIKRRFHDIDENLEQVLTTFVNDTGDNLLAVTTETTTPVNRLRQYLSGFAKKFEISPICVLLRGLAGGM